MRFIDFEILMGGCILADLCCTATAVALAILYLHPSVVPSLAAAFFLLHIWYFRRHEQIPAAETVVNAITSLTTTLPILESEFNSVKQNFEIF